MSLESIQGRTQVSVPPYSLRPAWEVRSSVKLHVVRDWILFLIGKLQREIPLSVDEQTILAEIKLRILDEKTPGNWKKSNENIILNLSGWSRASFETGSVKQHQERLLRRNLAISGRVFRSLEKTCHLQQWFRLTPRFKSRPVRFVGVGYKDKGHLRNVSYDGSPSWQEIAMDRRTKNVSFGKDSYFRSLFRSSVNSK